MQVSRVLWHTGDSAPGQLQSSTAASDKASEDWLSDGSCRGAQETRYVGFGNTAPPQKREDDFLNSAMSSLYSVRTPVLLPRAARGWSSFTTGASRFASAAKEGATKFGSHASQKFWGSKQQPELASELGHSLNDSVLKPAQEKVQGVGTRGWRDVTTFFSGKVEDTSDRYAGPLILILPEGQSYQNSGGDNSQNTIDQSFWEAFGTTDPAKAHRSPSSDSWTCADASADKRSSDSWDVWGSGSASNNKNSDSGDGWEAWWGGGEGAAKATREGAAKATRKAAPPTADEVWDNQDW
ncbi:ADP-ribosylation factor GTPase-activating protein 1 [Camelus dromedarius]|uniref:ADP-ribosylation factor GTPase-activating protein 1 n=1 Tax=Camelus dromedarius TaxID=9838 RepID=A0A5N4CTI3_CAMDR|nr:ADP-ribosylation factor GTPase-activating protein 1 [Camelus dromedarius]